MKLWIVGVALLLLAPAAGRAQMPPCCQALTPAAVDRMIPLLRAEVAGSRSLDAKLGQVAMMKSTYIALKNALMVARLDAADASRLGALPFDDGSRAARQANIVVYRANRARIDAALVGVGADPACGLCTPEPATSGATRRR